MSRHFQALYRFFRPRLGSEAPDLIQKTFLACVEAKDRVPEHVSFKAYLLGIARNQLLMFLRSQGRRGKVIGGSATSIAGTGPSPSGAVAFKQEQKLLLRALRLLPLDMQMTLELFYWEQLPRTEIAQVLEVQPATIKSRLERARAQLRTKILDISPDATGETTARDLEAWAESLRGKLDGDETVGE